MPDCQCLPKCPFFNDRMAGMPTMATQLKERFCKGDNTECARFMVFSRFGSEHVPPTLFPGQTEQAKRLLTAG